MALFEISFPSFNERDTIKGWIYTPVVPTVGVVQLVHGFGEHSRRYMHMIQAFLDAGFVVAADDHVGHGKTALDNDSWGDFGHQGYKITREDEHSLYEIVREKYPDLPYFMFGHSWGSMIVRDYLSVYGDDISAVILCGTGGYLESINQVADELDELISEGRGREIKPELLGGIFGDFVKRFGKHATPNDWIAVNPLIVEDHGGDPFNNLKNPPNVESLNCLAALWRDISSIDWARKVPDIPIYFIAGDQDPVGNYGEGIYQAANWLHESGKRDISVKLYSGYRHEIHNEFEIRDEVEQGMIEFLNDQLPK